MPIELQKVVTVTQKRDVFSLWRYHVEAHCLLLFPSDVPSHLAVLCIFYILKMFACKYSYVKYVTECRYLHAKMYFHSISSYKSCFSLFFKPEKTFLLVPVWGMVSSACFWAQFCVWKCRRRIFCFWSASVCVYKCLSVFFNDVLSARHESCFFVPNVMSFGENPCLQLHAEETS